MKAPRLGDMIREGRVTRTSCPRCHGEVVVPTEVWLKKHPTRSYYEPEARCRRCGVDFDWRTEINPAGGTAVYPQDRGKFNVWFCDRVLEAPAPIVHEEE